MHKRLMMLAGVVLGAVTLTGASTPSEAERAELAKLTAGMTAGKPESCLNNRQRTSLKSIGPYLIYRASPRRLYVNDTGGGCEGVARGDALITQTPSTRLCRGDIAQTISLITRFPSGNCALGEFVPYTAP